MKEVGIVTVMRRLRRYDVVPPGGWVWRDIDTKVLIRGITFDNLFSKVNDIRRRNGYSVYSREEFEDRFCRERLGDDREYVIGGSSSNVVLSADVMVLRATQASIDRWRRVGYDTVGVDELRRRVELCNSCIYNKDLVCASCLGYDTWVYGYIQHIGRERMSLLVNLRTCLVDKAMIVIDILNNSINYDRSGGYRDGCWKVNK